MKGIHVLLVEDEPVLAAIIKEALETRGFTVRIAVNGVDGWTAFHEQKPDICVVDIMLPRKNGYALVQEIRTVDEFIPLIFLTAKTQTEDVLKGLEIGADDYMKKPFSMEELVLRLHALIRRRQPISDLSDTVVVPLGQFFFYQENFELYDGVQRFALSQREGELLGLLLQYKNRLLERKTALLKLWGNDSPFNSRSMDVYITRLRKFIKGDANLEIVNVRGQGYTLIDRSEKRR